MVGYTAPSSTWAEPDEAASEAYISGELTSVIELTAASSVTW